MLASYGGIDQIAETIGIKWKFIKFEEKISSSGLKLKISKQKMLDGRFVLAESDAIKITIICPVYVKKDSKKIYQQLLQLGK